MLGEKTSCDKLASEHFSKAGKLICQVKANDQLEKENKCYR